MFTIKLTVTFTPARVITVTLRWTRRRNRM